MIKRLLQVAAIAIVTATSGVSVHAQIAPGGNPMIVPPPPPIPPPKIEVPALPKIDTMPPPPRAALPSRGSFGDRITNCLHDGAAAGLNSGDRAAYSRACANQ